MIKWFKHPFHRQAHAGGERWFDRTYKGGEFLPFYVPRPQMPQIDAEDMADFIEFAAAKGVKILVRYRQPRELHPHQRLDHFKASHMPPEVADKPVFTSKEHFILDGNHRWGYHRIHRSRVPCYEVCLSFERAIALMFAFPKTYALETHSEQN